MDHGLAATPTAAAAESLRGARGGEVVRWAEVTATAGAES
jgi:hypothetical protein